MPSIEMLRTSAVTLHQSSFPIFVSFVAKFIDYKPRRARRARIFLRLIADLWGAVKVTRASSSGPKPRICNPFGAKPRQTRMVWLPSRGLFPQILDEPFLIPQIRNNRPCCIPNSHLLSSGLGSKFGHLDSGSALHVPVRKFPEATESSCFIDTWGTYRSARNDDRRDDSP